MDLFVEDNIKILKSKMQSYWRDYNKKNQIIKLKSLSKIGEDKNML